MIPWFESTIRSAPSKLLAAPSIYPPPWMKTTTGNPPPRVATTSLPGVYTLPDVITDCECQHIVHDRAYFKNKQSSDWLVALFLIEVLSNGFVEELPTNALLHAFGCMVACWTPETADGGCGAAHLKSPMRLVRELILCATNRTKRTNWWSRVAYSKEAGGVCRRVNWSLVLSITQVNNGCWRRQRF